MPISEQTLETLEFPKIRDRLARHTSFSASRELALGLLPSTDAYLIRRRLRLTSEARRLLDERPDASIGGARDIRPAAGLARRGGVLDAAVFLEIAATLASGRRLRGLLLKQDAESFPSLRELAEDLPNLQPVEDAIAATIGEDGTVLDSASPKLGRLRAEVRIAFGRLQDKLQNMISSTQYGDSLQEPIITVRSGRYVVPVKASHKRNIRGLVHDQSASGATLYIEPIAIVELNNKWRELQLAEEEEVARILAELSERVGGYAAEIVAGVEALAALDLAFAMAKYSLALRCVEPEIVEGLRTEGRGLSEQSSADSVLSPQSSALILTQARHPLLDQSTVVPTDLYLGGEFRILLITGPNTGGKTVALKTTGLLALMAQAGLHIPAAEPARLPVFGQIFADIGDEQSIEQSLSTFSSHMSNIIRILRALENPQAAQDGGRRTKDEKAATTAALGAEELERLSNWRRADPNEWVPLEPVFAEPQLALVLLDELGAGTDPVEGAALARAIIERLLALGVLGVATTHYAELKAFAYATEGVQNGSVEFDVETLAPTYKLTIGLPGRSNALAIARRLGLSEALVERARSMMAREDAQVEDLLAGIHREREATALELKRTEELRDDAEKYRERLATELRDFERQREAEWQAARDQIDDELREVRGQLRRLRDEFRSVSVSRQWMEEAEKRLQETQGQIKEIAQPAAKPRPAVEQPAAQPQAPRPLQIGDTVLVRSVGLSGEILSIDEEEETAEVQVGGFRMQANLSELRRETKGDRKARPEPQRAESPRASLPPAADVGMSFDMRGWRAGEVADKLDRYLNDAYLAGLPYVRLIHGKGTGALRQIVRDTLTGHPLVASFGGGGPDGGEGVTVARLVER
ncbi:MAG TPA: endonuclease MutS2 [Roseiflexaceae bacterium]|nr:endonuclease MutS2 [Roseiflexaceae bacterium]